MCLHKTFYTNEIFNITMYTNFIPQIVDNNIPATMKKIICIYKSETYEFNMDITFHKFICLIFPPSYSFLKNLPCHILLPYLLLHTTVLYHI